SYLLEKISTDETLNHYNVSIAAEATDMLSQLASGSLDIAAVPTNAADSLYNKTSGGVKIIALNTASVLYILEKGETIKTVADLKGKTIYAVGQGSNPEYVLSYILSQNGLAVGTDVTVEFMESAELTARAASGDIDVCMLPVPAATTVLVKNQEYRAALGLGLEWDKLNNGSVLTMGCIVVRTEYYNEHKDAVDKFLKEYEESIIYVRDNPAEAGTLCEKFEIVPSAVIATKAIPDSNLIFVSGKEIRPAIEGYYQVLFDANPKSIGGAMPQDDFYPAE
ncbi:MAG: ABC transporter substrate-binding protein, partial [Erysipelotrichaceae bacterium]|nr:ABC transporter substrate-binding protein [Erysipelotrichaceae bacterium]